MIPNLFGRPPGKRTDDVIEVSCVLCRDIKKKYKPQMNVCGVYGWNDFLAINIGRYNRKIILFCRTHTDEEIDSFRVRKKYKFFSVVG